MYTKNEQPEYEAVVKWFNRPRGYGFANIEGIEQDIIIHQSVIEMDGYRYVNQDDTITIIGIEELDDGLRALKVIL